MLPQTQMSLYENNGFSNVQFTGSLINHKRKLRKSLDFLELEVFRL